jgi:hypothetical protein
MNSIPKYLIHLGNKNVDIKISVHDTFWNNLYQIHSLIGKPKTCTLNVLWSNKDKEHYQDSQNRLSSPMTEGT